MPFITSPIPDNEDLRAVGHDYLESTWGDYLSTTAADALYHSPTWSIGRMNELAAAAGEPLPADFLGASSFYDRPEEPPARFLSRDEWRTSEYYRKGLTFPQGVTEPVATILADRYDERKRREDIISRAPRSWMKYPAALAATLAGSLVDPLNVGSAFVPVVSQARYAAMAGTLGKPLARVVTGAVEGAVGQAMLEPVLYAAARSEQEDYTMANSLMNTAFGSILGGGLHVGAGAIGDLLGKLAPRTREDILRAAVGQLADAKAVDVEPIVRIAKALEIERPRARPLPGLGDTVQFERGWPAQTVTADVIGLRPHPVTGDLLPVVDLAGNQRLIFEWHDSGQVVSAAPSFTAEVPMSGLSRQAIDDMMNEGYRLYDEVRARGISHRSIQADYGAEGVQALQRKFPGLVKKKGGVPLDELAAELGFERADDLFQALYSYKPKSQSLRELNDPAFWERYIEQNEPVLEEFRLASRDADEIYNSHSWEEHELSKLEDDAKDYVYRVEELRASGLVDEERLAIMNEAFAAADEVDTLANALDRAAECLAMKAPF